MVTEKVNKMMNDKAPGPIGVVVEMLKAGGNTCSDIVTDIVNAFIQSGMDPSVSQVSYTVNSFKG